MALPRGGTTHSNDEMVKSEGVPGRRGQREANLEGNLNLPFFYRPENDIPSPLPPLFLLHQCPLDAILKNSFWQNKRKRSQQLTSSSIWSCLKQCTFRNSKINYFKFPSFNSWVMPKKCIYSSHPTMDFLAVLDSMKTWRFVLRRKHLKCLKHVENTNCFTESYSYGQE